MANGDLGATMDVDVRIAVTRLPHAADLPLPAYATDQAAGMDLLAAVTADLVRRLRWAGRSCPPVSPSPCRRAGRRRSGAPGLAAKNGVTVAKHRAPSMRTTAARSA